MISKLFVLIMPWNIETSKSSSKMVILFVIIVQEFLNTMVEQSTNIGIFQIIHTLFQSLPLVLNSFWKSFVLLLHILLTLLRHLSQVTFLLMSAYMVVFPIIIFFESFVCLSVRLPHKYMTLEPRARLCCFLGYDIKHKRYKCQDPIFNHLHVPHHVILWEYKMFSYLHPFKSWTHISFFTNTSIDYSQKIPHLYSLMKLLPNNCHLLLILMSVFLAKPPQQLLTYLLHPLILHRTTFYHPLFAVSQE